MITMRQCRLCDNSVRPQHWKLHAMHLHGMAMHVVAFYQSLNAHSKKIVNVKLIKVWKSFLYLHEKLPDIIYDINYNNISSLLKVKGSGHYW